MVAVGEIGLDYYWKEVPRDLQKEVFRAQLQLARDLDLPVIVHDRGGPRRLPGHGEGVPRGAGGVPAATPARGGRQDLVKLGWHLSFTGTITFKNARKAPEVIAAVPLERIMVETDAPTWPPSRTGASGATPP